MPANVPSSARSAEIVVSLVKRPRAVGTGPQSARDAAQLTL